MMYINTKDKNTYNYTLTTTLNATTSIRTYIIVSNNMQNISKQCIVTLYKIYPNNMQCLQNMYNIKQNISKYYYNIKQYAMYNISRLSIQLA